MIDNFTEHRSLLFGLAYRMLGRVAEAEDMVQETWLRWQKQDSQSIDSPRAWLTTTLTRLCIDHLRSAAHQREHYYGVWLPEPFVESLAAAPSESAELADSLSMAFMLMLEKLSPVERAVFLLRQVFDLDYAEIAAIVGKSEANCRQIVSRAKSQLLRGERPAETPPTEVAQRLAEKFLTAARSGDLSDLMALLKDDATMYTDGGGVVSSAGRPIATADRIARFFIGIRRKSPGRKEHFPALVNGRVGALEYVNGVLDRAISFDFENEKIARLYIVRNPEKLRHLARPAGAVLLLPKQLHGNPP
ncbi:MAG TPA: RNA polymerase sigma-70 factor [Opitutaceae bacterium]|nr:RNA polymerase sigma-70 factor [Opitutaceae bacterium]